MATLMPWAAANALITVASTLLGTELHARFTFGAGRRARWHQHLQSAGSAIAAYLATSAAILVLHAVQPSASIGWEQAVYLSASGLAGTGRFLVLRLYVFAQAAPPAPTSVECGRYVPAPHRAVFDPVGGYLPLPTSDWRRTERRRQEEVTARCSRTLDCMEASQAAGQDPGSFGSVDECAPGAGRHQALVWASPGGMCPLACGNRPKA
ncbi:hypothetical protein AB0H57_29630 [Micromonospora sp. NPDC050686]|uniref:hypothetical protein n=1 Tax=Micromonospora sp. NPDC050686 TaxID=3154631 RepID=UPI0033DA81B7